MKTTTMKTGPKESSGSGRLETLDLLRGLTLVSMILYHGMWDVLYLSESGRSMKVAGSWYEGRGGFLWQQSICWTFILLSGFCVPLSKRIIRRGIMISLGGLAVTAVTCLGMYDQRVLCGVLSFLGAAMLLTGAVKEVFKKKQPVLPDSLSFTSEGKSRAPASAGDRTDFFSAGRSLSARYAPAGLAVCSYLFYVTRWINRERIRLWPGREMAAPPFLYAGEKTGLTGLLSAALGFPGRDFFSTDYFSLIPWIFLFWAGLFLHGLLCSGLFLSFPGQGRLSKEERAAGVFSHPVMHLQAPLLNAMGRHSLLIYLLHQPVLYLLTRVLF